MENPTAIPPTPPELLAPAGDADCARAAVENGADAIYFGLRSGLNARARAVNFALEEIPDLVAGLHLRGVRAALTLNTLVFSDELDELERTVHAAVAAGVDAVLVQDLGAARRIHAIAPDLPIHASTQMSLTSAEGIRAAQSLGIRRVVLARELSLAEIRQIHGETSVELEVFVHGALCMSYSGQCMASFAMGGRSGNRGQCAQACRLPYEVLCDGRPVELEDRRYPLSPLDLAAWDLVPELIAAGVRALKIEGRLKSAQYVAVATRLYRRAIDDAMAGRRFELGSPERADLEMTFSRGLSHGWLDGRDDRALVPGQSSAKRGVFLGTVRSIHRDRVTAELAAPVRRGDGVVFQSEPGEADPQGGRVYEVFQHGQSAKGPVVAGSVELSFGRHAIDFSRLRPGQKIWKTDDPQLARRLRKTYSGMRRRVPLDLTIVAASGRRLCLTARADSGAACQIESPEVLEEAVRHPLTAELLREQFGRLGNSVYELRRLEARIEGQPMVPLSVLGRLRHELIAQLDASMVPPLPLGATNLRSVPGGEGVTPDGSLTDDIRSEICPCEPSLQENASPAPFALHVLCRDLAQLESVLALGVSSVIADFAEIARYREATALARGQGAAIFLATPRIQKPGEAEMFRRIADAQPDGLLVRNLAGAAFCAAQQIPFVADSTLHAANPWTVAWLHQLGACRVTTAGELDREKLLALVAASRAEQLEVVVHQHLPMFHTEHCIYCAAEIAGADRAHCQRPCRHRDVRLRDRLGVEHPVRADACCRNTVYHAQPRSLLDLVPELRRRGVKHFRIDLLDGTPDDRTAGLIAAIMAHL